ncbi:MAG: hypothetical protein ACXVBW_01760 [Bdellovibrionota bacterium]
MRGRWVPENTARAELKKRFKKIPPFESAECPACVQTREQVAMGVVELRGARWREMSDEVMKTVLDSERIARLRNDQQRILFTRSARGVLKLYLTLPELAHHIGRELMRTFKGDVEVLRSTEEPFVRLIWDSDIKDSEAKRGTPRRSRAWRGRGTHHGSRLGSGRNHGG